MTIDEEIERHRALAREIRLDIIEHDHDDNNPHHESVNARCYELAQENEQIANWLERYKHLCELVRWETVRNYNMRTYKMDIEYDDRLSPEAVMEIIYCQIKEADERRKYEIN